MKLATQQEVDLFYSKYFNDPEIYPYLSTTQYTKVRTVEKEDWNGICMVNESTTALLAIDISRQQCNGISIAVWSKNIISSGRCIKEIEKLVKRYDSMYVQSVVHESNKRSFAMTERMLGSPWGFEPKGAWNSLAGKWEGLFWFKKILR